MSEASFNLTFIRLLPRAYNLRNFKNNNKMIFFCNLQPTRCAKIQTSWAWNCCSIILTKSVWKVVSTMGHDVHGIETLSAVCHEISSLLLDETSQVLSVSSYLRTSLSMLLHTICLKEKKENVKLLYLWSYVRHDSCHDVWWFAVATKDKHVAHRCLSFRGMSHNCENHEIELNILTLLWSWS